MSGWRMFFVWLMLAVGIIAYAWVKDDWSEITAKLYWSGFGIAAVYMAREYV